MTDYTPDEILAIYEDVKKRVYERYEMRTSFAGNLAGFAGTVFVTYVFAQMNILPGFLHNILPWIMGFWLIGLSVHSVNWLLYELRERAVRREIDRIGLGWYDRRLMAKRKRMSDEPEERLVRLSDDGEIIDLYHDEYADYETRRSR
jgi:hypothetical protein